MTIKKLIIRILVVLIATPFGILTCIFLNFHLISFISKGHIFQNVGQLPENEYALVLGAGEYKPGLWINHAFNHRIGATIKLFENKKIHKIILSGSSIPGKYNEPEEMRQVLLEYGIPDSTILMDTLGIRTWESVRRVKEYFHLNKIIIISQQSQLERALFSASCIGIEAIGFKAHQMQNHYWFWQVREYLSRMKCIPDCVAYHLKIS